VFAAMMLHFLSILEGKTKILHEKYSAKLTCSAVAVPSSVLFPGRLESPGYRLKAHPIGLANLKYENI
jgi:hypothetical protein